MPTEANSVISQAEPPHNGSHDKSQSATNVIDVLRQPDLMFKILERSRQFRRVPYREAMYAKAEVFVVMGFDDRRGLGAVRNWRVQFSRLRTG